MPPHHANITNALRRAVDNIVSFGDTDIFPFPFETRVFRDLPQPTLALLEELHNKFSPPTGSPDSCSLYPPEAQSTFAPVGYAAYRWATQIDPLWNAYLLGLVCYAAEKIEQVRIPASQNIVHSYRVDLSKSPPGLFNSDFGWRSFMSQSIENAQHSSHVVTCDISDFYARVPHHRLLNALQQAGLPDEAARIDKLLRILAGSRSAGLPVGGPAARLLAELLLNATDRLLLLDGVRFCRFVDDYHLFADSENAAHSAHLKLADKLQMNEGLSLQKSKARVTRAQDFVLSTSRVLGLADATSPADEERNFLRLHLRYDPYSADPEGDYDRLVDSVKQFDIVGMLERELDKSRIHSPLVTQLLRSVEYLDATIQPQIARALVQNLDVLAPVFSRVMLVLIKLLTSIPPADASLVVNSIRALFDSNSYLVSIGLNRQYALRVLATTDSPEHQQLFAQAYLASSEFPLVRRDIHLAMVQWRQYAWVSERLRHFLQLDGWERRAAIVGSYILGDEGAHWRRANKGSFSPFEILIRDWVAQNPSVNVTGLL